MRRRIPCQGDPLLIAVRTARKVDKIENMIKMLLEQKDDSKLPKAAEPTSVDRQHPMAADQEAFQKARDDDAIEAQHQALRDKFGGDDDFGNTVDEFGGDDEFGNTAKDDFCATLSESGTEEPQPSKTRKRVVAFLCQRQPDVQLGKKIQEERMLEQQPHSKSEPTVAAEKGTEEPQSSKTHKSAEMKIQEEEQQPHSKSEPTVAADIAVAAVKLESSDDELMELWSAQKLHRPTADCTTTKSPTQEMEPDWKTERRNRNSSVLNQRKQSDTSRSSNN